MNKRVTVLVVDDEPAIRRLLHASLARADYHVIEAGSAREALFAVQAEKPDVVLLDLGLPDRDGLELIALIKPTGIAVIVVSARDATEQKVAALDLGADDYVSKPFDSEEVLARIRTALRHQLRSQTQMPLVRFGNVEIDLSARIVRRDEAEIHLTPKEYDFLAELAKSPGRVVTHTHLLRTVWGPGHDGDVEYLRVAARSIRRKLEADPSRPLLLRNEPGVGYRLQDIR
jgi:two-component system, OmpR family, KDP operon response regulator KdpE